MITSEANQYLCAIILTLADVDGAPEGHLYAGMGMGATGKPSLGDFTLLMTVATRAGLITVASHWVVLTPKGHEMAREIKSTLTTKRVSKENSNAEALRVRCPDCTAEVGEPCSIDSAITGTVRTLREPHGKRLARARHFNRKFGHAPAQQEDTMSAKKAAATTETPKTEGTTAKPKKTAKKAAATPTPANDIADLEAGLTPELEKDFDFTEDGKATPKEEVKAEAPAAETGGHKKTPKSGKKASTRTEKVAATGEKHDVVLVIEKTGKKFSISACIAGREPISLYTFDTHGEAQGQAKTWSRRAPGRKPTPLGGVEVKTCTIDDRSGAEAA